MTENSGPPRLIDDPELGPAIRAAREETLSPERLAANARALDARLTKLPPPGRVPLGTTALTAGAIIAAFAVLRLVAGPALFGSGGTAPAPAPEMAPGPVAEVSPETPELAAPPATAPLVATATSTGDPETPAPAPTPALALSTPIPAPSPVPATGTLADELRLYDEARALAVRGDEPAALARLDELARRFPAGALAPEAAITRAEVLVSAGRLDDASALLARLVADPVHAGRRAELERTLGDVERARGDCASARAHYRAALDAGAAGDEASAVRRGIGACEAE